MIDPKVLPDPSACLAYGGRRQSSVVAERALPGGPSFQVGLVRTAEGSAVEAICESRDGDAYGPYPCEGVEASSVNVVGEEVVDWDVDLGPAAGEGSREEACCYWSSSDLCH